jgi:thermolysin
VARPFVQKTFDAEYSFPSTVYLPASADNTWPRDNIVNIHTYIGYAYDFYFITLGLKGVNGNNRPLSAFGHVFSKSRELYDNAFWNPNTNYLYGVGLYFLEPYQTTQDNGAAIDVVGHEYSHAVTYYHAELRYLFESGALSESFSDIMGTAIEFAFQPEGEGYNEADWYHGEDRNPTFSYSECRCQSDPNVNSQLKNGGLPHKWWLPDPCHLSQQIPPYSPYGYIWDNGGVHLNCTIFPHAFYLLAHGGTNKISGVSVEGIGLNKAITIFYSAWVHHMISTTNFLGAANALLKSSYEIYGGSSAEYEQTVNAIRAIGYIVK